MEVITTNDRFDRLTNLDISTHYSDGEYWFMKSDFLGALAYCVVVQSPYDTPDIAGALKSFDEYLGAKFTKSDRPEKFTYTELQSFINEDVFESIPEIEKLNHRKNGNNNKYGFCSRYDQPDPDDDFIDLGALARNVFYMLLREQITQNY